MKGKSTEQIQPRSKLVSLVLSDDSVRSELMQIRERAGFQKTTGKEGLLLLAIQPEGEKAELLKQSQNCRFRLRERQSGKDKIVSVREGLMAEPLSEGTWDIKRLGCGVGRVWEFESLFSSGIKIKPGYASVAGWLIPQISGDEQLNMRLGGREDNTRLAETLVRVSSDGSEASFLAGALISAFTAKEIPRTVKSKDEVVRISTRTLTRAGQQPSSELDQAALSPLLQKAQACATEGLLKDPLRAGEIELTADYKSGKSIGAKSVGAKASADSPIHAMADALELCFINSLNDFKGPIGSDFQLKLVY